MSVSATWQVLPRNLRMLVQQGECSLAEAAELWDLFLLMPDGETQPLPPRLYPVASKLHLLDLPAVSTRH